MITPPPGESVLNTVFLRADVVPGVIQEEIQEAVNNLPVNTPVTSSEGLTRWATYIGEKIIRDR